MNDALKLVLGGKSESWSRKWVIVAVLGALAYFNPNWTPPGWFTETLKWWLLAQGATDAAGAFRKS